MCHYWETCPFLYEVYCISVTCSRIPYAKKLKCIVPYVNGWMFYIPYFLSESIVSDLAKEVIWTNFLIPLIEKTCLIIWCQSPFQYVKKPENDVFIHLLNEYLLSFWCAKAQVWFLSFIIFSRHKPLHLLSIDFLKYSFIGV